MQVEVEESSAPPEGDDSAEDSGSAKDSSKAPKVEEAGEDEL